MNPLKKTTDTMQSTHKGKECLEDDLAIAHAKNHSTKFKMEYKHEHIMPYTPYPKRNNLPEPIIFLGSRLRFRCNLLVQFHHQEG